MNDVDIDAYVIDEVVGPVVDDHAMVGLAVGVVPMGAWFVRTWVVDGVVAPRTVTTLGVAIDHRVVDGEQGAGFLRRVADLLAEPSRLLLTDDRESLP